MPSERPTREHGIDALRGLAIVMMVASHLARELLIPPHPLWLRAYGSLAAPLFVVLAGLLVAQTCAGSVRSLNHYFVRGGMILLLAAAIDIGVWGLYPFITVDVLYLIGVAVPLTAVYAGLAVRWQLGLLVLLLGLTGLLRSLLGYPEHVVSVVLGESPQALVDHAADIGRQWLVAGWFPLLPWLFLSLLGVRLFQWRRASAERFSWHVQRVGWPLMGMGLLCGWLVPVETMVRGGYSELFYPPTVAFVLVASGAVLVIFPLVTTKWLTGNRPLILLGKCSLLMYVGHLIVIHWGLRPLLDEVALPMYFVLYVALLLAMVGTAGAIESLKRRSQQPWPFVLRFLLGG